MAQYKVPQDVEAEDKLLGPFTFRQFIYLLIVAGCIGAGVVIAKALFWGFALLFLPPVIFFGILALPIKRDQPMETYLGAMISFWRKPHVRPWVPGQPETTIEIAAPKLIEEDRTNGLSQEEASHRLSFLANLIDTEGYAIKEGAQSSLQDTVYAEAQAQRDIFELPQNSGLDQAIQTSTENHHQMLVDQMRAAIQSNNAAQLQNTTIETHVKPEPVPVSPNIEGSEAAAATVAEQQIPQAPQAQVPNLPPSNFQVPQYYDVPQNKTMAQPLVEAAPAPAPTPIPEQQAAPAPQAKPAGTSLADAGEIDEYQAPVEASAAPVEEEKPKEPQSSVIVAADMPVEAVFVPEPINPYAEPTPEQEAERAKRKAAEDAMQKSEELTDAQRNARNAVARALSKSGAGVNVEDFNAIRDEHDSKAATSEPEAVEETEEPEESDANMIELANNNDFTVETIAKQANRVKENQQNGEVYISLH